MTKKKLTIGFSPCPNDCFIFDALVHHKIDTAGVEFDVVMEDVEALNKRALKGELDITKLSYHAYVYLTEQYVLLNSGSALGFNCGPLLISKHKVSNLKEVDHLKIAIPGKNTTANFLLSIAFPNATQKTELLFSDIEQAVIDGKVDAGLIIHENRFTYEQKGLTKIIDLGEYWESLIHAPIPLGGIVVNRRLDLNTQQVIDALIRKSVEYAFANPEGTMTYVKQHAQEMNEEVMKKHIDLYVNSFSIDLGEVGKQAVQLLFNKAYEQGFINKVPEQIFI